MDYIRQCARGSTDQDMINEVVYYNHRTCPIEGDLVELAVSVGLSKFLDHLLDNMGEELMQEHMMTAVKARKRSMVKNLMSRGLSVNEFSQGKTYLGHSCSKGSLAMTRCLVKFGAEVDAKDASGSTPLLNCAKSSPFKFLVPTMKVLLKHGADERTQDNNQNDMKTCLMARNHVQALLLLRSVQNWRARKNFKEVCRSFNNLGTKKSKKKSSTKSKTKSKTFKKSRNCLSSLSFLELNPDILSEVFSFF